MCDSKANQGEMQEPHHSLIVRVVSSVLDKLISGHVESPKHTLGCGNEFMKFQSSYAPDVSIESYLERVRRYSRCSDACFVMALIYVDRLIESKNLVLTSLNAHRLLITSVMLAAKFHDDLFYNNAYYSKLGGLSLNELNHLEAELLHLLDFSLFVKEVAYCKYSMQLQNYVFYLEVVPAPRSAGPPPMLANINMPHMANMSQGFVDSAQAQAQAAAMSAYFAPQVAQSLRQAALGNMGFQYPSQAQTQDQSHGQGQYASSALCVPSPDNPHAKACSFSEHYLSANSPLRIAPCAVASASANAAAASAVAANANARQALLQAQAQVLSQRYSQNYFRDASECPSACAASSGSGMGGYFNNYTPAYSASASAAPMVCSARDPMRDSIDETSTTCSTRTASPYPALYSRTSSSNMLLAGPSGTSGSGMHSAVLTPSMYPAQGVLNMHQVHSLPAHAQQQLHGGGVSGVVSAGGVWGGESYHSPMQCAMQQQSAMHGHGVYSTHSSRNTHSMHPHHTQAHHTQAHHTQHQQGGGYQRTDLSIQTDLQDAYPMQRSDSNISAASATTPYSAYHPAHSQQQQQVQQQQGQGQYRLSPVNRSIYPANTTYASHSNSASHANTPNHYYQSQLTPTERRYQPNYFASAEAYNYRNSGGNECEASVTTPRDYYSHDYTTTNNANQCANNSSAYPRHFPCPSAMLYASNTSMGMHNPNVNVNMHGAMSDPMNFYGYSAGVNAGQM